MVLNKILDYRFILPTTQSARDLSGLNLGKIVNAKWNYELGMPPDTFMTFKGNGYIESSSRGLSPIGGGVSIRVRPHKSEAGYVVFSDHDPWVTAVQPLYLLIWQGTVRARLGAVGMVGPTFKIDEWTDIELFWNGKEDGIGTATLIVNNKSINFAFNTFRTETFKRIWIGSGFGMKNPFYGDISKVIIFKPSLI